MSRAASVALLVVALALAGCGERGTPGGASGGLVAEGPATGHVHAVGVDPRDGAVVIAAHSGLFRAEVGAPRAGRLGDDRRDAMGFTVEGPGRYVASGHPDVREGGPSSVGLIRTADAGRTWQTVSLRGEADLHVLEVAPGRVYGFDALSGRFLASRDGGRTWRRSEVAPLVDLAVDPADPDHLVASAELGLLRSADGGRTWRPAARVEPTLLSWTEAHGLLLVGYDGIVRRLAAPDGTPQDVGTLPVPPAAVAASGGELLVAADDGSVRVSRDGGRTWADRLGPAA